VSPFAEVHQLDHIEQFVEVFGDLLDVGVIADGGQGEARQGRIVRGRHIEGLDVVTALGEQAHHARQGTGFIFHQD
jgi:hypothetical protein